MATFEQPFDIKESVAFSTNSINFVLVFKIPVKYWKIDVKMFTSKEVAKGITATRAFSTYL